MGVHVQKYWWGEINDFILRSVRIYFDIDLKLYNYTILHGIPR